MIPDGNSTHGIVVDGDGTVWFAGRGNFVARLDPVTGLFDQYQETEQGLHGNTPVFTSKGDLWFTQLIGNKIGHWERATDTITYYESPVPNANPYGMEIDHQDKVWYSEYFAGAITRFDPESKTFKRFKVQTWPNSLRRLGADSEDNNWFGVYGYIGKYGRLGRIDAKTGQMTEIVIPIKYGQPYDARPDVEDNVWISSMNYLSKFDQKTMKFTIYPTLQRTDQPKLEVTRDGAVWYAPRRAGGSGYGGAATALYPDKDAIETLRAVPSPRLSNSYIANYRGPFRKVTGTVKLSESGAQNQVDYENKTAGKPRTAATGTPVRENVDKLDD
jgi:streptogramin lyase